MAGAPAAASEPDGTTVPLVRMDPVAARRALATGRRIVAELGLANDRETGDPGVADEVRLQAAVPAEPDELSRVRSLAQ